MAKIEITADTLSADLVAEIATHIKNDLDRGERRAVPMDSVQRCFGHRVSDLTANQFKLALSRAIADKRLPGLCTKVGKGGGIGIDDGTVPAPRKPRATNGTRTRKVKEAAEPIDISIGTKQYALPMPAEMIENLFVSIFDLTPNDEGDIKIGEKTFSTTDENAHKYIENCIWYNLKNSANTFIDSDDSDDESEDLQEAV